MALDTSRESAWPLLPSTAHLQAPEEFPPGPPPPSRLPVDGWAGAATRGLVATLASAGAALVGMAVTTAVWTLALGTPTSGSDALVGTVYGLVFAIVGAVPAALVAVVVGAPAGLFIGLAARVRRPAVARLLAVVAAVAVVLPVVLVSGAWPPFYGLLIAPVVAAVLSRWVVWAKEIPPKQLR